MTADSARLRATTLLLVAFAVLMFQFQGAWAAPRTSASGQGASKAQGKAMGHLKNGKAEAVTPVTLAVGAPPTTIAALEAAPLAAPRVSAKNSRGAGGGDDAVLAQAQAGTITIKKDAVPDDSQSFHFTGDLGPFDLKDEVGLSFSDLEPGTYLVTEAREPGWRIDHIVCGDPLAGASIVDRGRTVTIDLPPGGNTTCTFVNRRAETSEPDPDDVEGDGERNPGAGGKKGQGDKPLPFTGGPEPDWFLFSAGMFLVAGGILLRMERQELYL